MEKWAYVLVPIFFLVIGYGTAYYVGKPVVNVVKNALTLLLLNEAPTFDKVEAKQEEFVASDTTEETINLSTLAMPAADTQYGQVIIPSASITEPLMFGDTDADLRVGAGQYTGSGSAIPGQLGAVLIGGHNTGSFGRFDLINVGDDIEIQTSYGTYHYTVTETVVENANVQRVLDAINDKTKRQVILYTCYPLTAIGLTADRLFVYGEYTSGPLIDDNA